MTLNIDIADLVLVSAELDIWDNAARLSNAAS
jgi:hypothetical protein